MKSDRPQRENLSGKASAGLRRPRGLQGLAWAGAVLLFLTVAPISAAWADEFYVETPGLGDREEAMSFLQKAEELGVTGQIVRRFQRGQGWEFVLRSGTCRDRAEAGKTQEILQQATGLAATVYTRDGALVEMKTTVPPPGVKSEPDLTASLPAPPEPEPVQTVRAMPREVNDLVALGEGDAVAGRRLLDSVLRAHGAGVAGENTLKKSSMLHFRFEREVWNDDGTRIRVWHDFWRDSGRTRIEVRVLEGKGKNSTAILDKESAWLLVDGKVQPQDKGAVGQAISCFAPEMVLAQPLEVSTFDAARGAQLVGTESLGGRTLARLAIVDDTAGVSRSIAVDDVDHRVREDSMKADVGEVVWRYRDYHELEGGMVVPFQIDVWREGELRERVSVLELAMNAKPEGKPFDPGSLRP